MAAKPPYRSLGTDLLCLLLGPALYWLPTWAAISLLKPFEPSSTTGFTILNWAVSAFLLFPLAVWGMRWIGKRMGGRRDGHRARRIGMIGIDLALLVALVVSLTDFSGPGLALPSWWKVLYEAWWIPLIMLFSSPGWIAAHVAWLSFEVLELDRRRSKARPSRPRRPFPIGKLFFPFRAIGRFLLCMIVGAALFWAPVTALLLPVDHGLAKALAMVLAVFVCLPLLYRTVRRLQRRYPDRIAPAGVIGGVLLGIDLLPNLFLSGFFHSWERAVEIVRQGWWLHPMFPITFLATGMLLPWLLVHMIGLPTLIACLRSGRPLPALR